MGYVYAGITIGPVVRTLALGRTPREIRQASYIFSKISEIMVKELQADKERVTLYSPDNIDPKTGKNTLGDSEGIGLYSDHIFLKFNGTEDEVRNAIAEARKEALKVIADDMQAVTGKPSVSCLEFLEGYVYTMSHFVSDEKYNSIPMKALAQELDLLELRAPLIENEDLMLEYLDDNKLKKSKLFRDTEEIPDMENLGQRAPKSLQCSDYIAVVQADGDSMGTLLSAFSDLGEKGLEGVKAVSRFLFAQGAKNAAAVKEFGGVPVYFGGDDMLFLAPLFGTCEGKTKSLFSLIQRISENFDIFYQMFINEFNKKDGSVKSPSITPTLSFGVAIGYYKQPLREIFSSAGQALFGEAKNAKWGKKEEIKKREKLEKKAVSIHLRKHSGQESRALLSCHNEYPSMQELINLTGTSLDNEIVHSIHWKVRDQHNILVWLLEHTGDKRDERIKAWFKNNFNELADADSDTAKKWGDGLCDMLKTVYDADQKSFEDTVDGLFRLEEFMHLKNYNKPKNEEGRTQQE